MKVVWSPRAQRRALEIADAIAADRPEAAAAWLEELIARVGELDRLAKRGQMMPEIGKPEYRELTLAPYRVIYRIYAPRIIVLTVRHSRRAFDRREVETGER